MKWLVDHWAQCVTAIVAVYGAVLSTINLVSLLKEKKKRLTVKLSAGWIPTAKTNSDNLILIEVVNLGYRPVTVEAPYIILPDGKYLVMPLPRFGDKFPYELREGKKCSFWIEEIEIRQTLKEKGYSGNLKLYAEVSDQTGKKYRARKAFIYNLNE
jgi:hypothetical protein